MIQKVFMQVCLAAAECKDFHISATSESHVRKEVLPQTFLSEALMVDTEQMEQTCSSWLKIQNFADLLMVPNIFAAAEEEFSLHILAHDPLQCTMCFGID